MKLRPWRNWLIFHEQLMALFLQKRGWVVFYLEPHARFCAGRPVPFDCWLALYQSGEKANGGKP